MLPWVSSTFDHLFRPVHTYPDVLKTLIFFCISVFHSHINGHQKCGFFKNGPDSGDFWKCQLLVYAWKDENRGFWIRWCHTSLLLALRMLFCSACFALFSYVRAKTRKSLSFTYTANGNVRFTLRISQNRRCADKNSSKQFLWTKNCVKLIHLGVEIMISKRYLKRKLGHVVQIRLCRLT